MSDKELEMQEDDNLVNEEEVTLDSASTEEIVAEAEEIQPEAEDDSEELVEEKPAMPKTKIGMINAIV